MNGEFSDLSDRGAKSVRSLNPQQDVPTPLKGEVF